MQRTVQNRSVTVVGLDAAGLSAAQLAKRQGARSVVVQDPRDAADCNADDLLALAREDIRIELGVRRWNTLASSDLVVAAPCAASLPALELAASLGVELVSEVELASWYTAARLVLVTGTVGRRSCAALLAELLRADGRKLFVGGGVDAPLSAAVDTPALTEADTAVLALSPGVLGWTRTLHPALCVLSSVEGPEGQAPSTAASFQRAWLAARRDSHVVVPGGSSLWGSLARAGAAAVHTHGGPKGDGRWEGEMLVLPSLRVPRESIAWKGTRARTHLAAAGTGACVLGVAPRTIRQTLGSFAGLPHRAQLVLEDDGIRYIDDAQATTVQSTLALLSELDRSAVLLLGSLPEDTPLAPLCAALDKRARAVVLVGSVPKSVRRALGRSVPLRDAGDLFDAVSTARGLARKGDAVVFSPGCAPGELADNPEEAGRLFASAARALAGTARVEEDAEFEVDLEEG